MACAALLWLVLAGARADPAGPGPGATLNFPSTDIEAAAQAMAAILDRPILVDPRVKGQISLYSAQPVSPTRAYQMFLAALRGLGYAVVESGGLLKVVPEADAKLQTGEVVVGRAERGGDQVATQVFRVVHENASSLVTVLRPLISPNNTINVNPGNNTLVVTDYSANLQRIGTLIAALDTPSATDVEVIRLQHTVAADLVVTVQRLADTGTGGGTGSGTAAGAAAGGGALSISTDVHINALLVRAPNPARLAAVRALVARLDQPGTAGVAGSNIHVVYLKHADATRLAQVLRAAFSPDLARNSSGSASSGAAATPSAQTVGAGGGAAAATASGATSAQATAAVSATAQPSTGGYIQADPASNALIVTAVEPLYRQLRAVIEQLDTRRAQLYVESLVVEVDASKAVDVGLQWKQIFEISTATDLTLGTVVRALEATAGTNILSTANLVTLDNEEAKIVVGQNVPFVTGQYSSSSSSSNPFQTIERKDVGITLRIRPQIGANGTVRMAIFQESSSVSSTAAAGTSNSGPTTNKRSIESTVVVDDGKIIVLGGLIEDSHVADRAQIPILGDLPVLGAIFRSLSHSRRKTNLLVFLRPVIMRDEVDAQARTLDRYDFIRAQQQLVQPQQREPLSVDDGPMLPAEP